MRSPHEIDREKLPNYGTRNPFPAVPAPGGGFILQGNAQLVSARDAARLPWVITLEPCTKKKSIGTSPWFTPWDGTTGLLGGNEPVNSGGGYKCQLTWGAGGIRQNAMFDYPMAGGSFSLVADTVDLQVLGTDATTVYPTLDDVPVFGAFMVPGELATDSGMMLSDVPQGVSAAIGDHMHWSVKPHARWLWVSQRVAANAAALYSVSFGSAAGSDDLWCTFLGQDAGIALAGAPVPIPVPPQATHVTITNLTGGGAGMLFNVLWGLRFG